VSCTDSCLGSVLKAPLTMLPDFESVFFLSIEGELSLLNLLFLGFKSSLDSLLKLGEDAACSSDMGDRGLSIMPVMLWAEAGLDTGGGDMTGEREGDLELAVESLRSGERGETRSRISPSSGMAFEGEEEDSLGIAESGLPTEPPAEKTGRAERGEGEESDSR